MAEPTQRTYTSDHSDTVLKAHGTRTAENSAAYLLNSGCIKETSHILDIGCGPGTISCDFASLAPKGKIVGIETNDVVLYKARAIAQSRNLTNIEFTVGDVQALDFPDASFDIVHTHQVLQHVADPIKSLQEMLRVTKPGGVVAARTADFSTLAMYPDGDGLLEEWKQLYLSVAFKSGSNPDAGRKMLSWTLAAGAKDIRPAASVWYLNTPEGRHFWASTWSERMTTSFRDAAERVGLADGCDLQKYINALKKWETAEGGVMMLTQSEFLCFV